MLPNLIELQKDIAKTTARASKEACDEAREITYTILGVAVVLKYESTQGRSTITTYSGVFLDGERFGTETERHPWSIFEKISTWYSCGDLLLLHQAEAIIKRARVTDVSAVEEPYPTETSPLRYYFQADSLKSVVRLWKTLKTSKLEKLQVVDRNLEQTQQ